MTEYLIELLIGIPCVIIALVFHELAHGFIAYKLGDPTAKIMGRLTLNPLKHLDIMGTLSMIFFKFGWAKPVPIDSRYFKKPRRDIALSSVAGPVSNLLLAFAFVVILRIIYEPLMRQIYSVAMISGAISAQIAYYIWVFICLAIRLNITLAVFNLLPIPPLDGSRLITSFLPPKAAYWVIRNERVIYIVLLVALFVGVLDPLLNIVTSGLMNLIYLVFGI